MDDPVSANKNRSPRGYTAWPKIPGQINFDLNKGLRETPYQNSNKRKLSQPEQAATHEKRAAEPPYDVDQLVNMSSDEHHQLVSRELAAIGMQYGSGTASENHPIDAQFSGTSVSDFRSSSSLADGETSSCHAQTRESERKPAPCSSSELHHSSYENGDAYTSHGSSLETGSTFSSSISLPPFHQVHEDKPPSALVRDLETRAITVPQLIQEVKGIYAGLIMVEKKCVEIVSQRKERPVKLSNDQWKAIIALHRTLLSDHHDFFSATQHPIAPTPLRMLAHKFAIPQRMSKSQLGLLEVLNRQCHQSPGPMRSALGINFGMLNRLMTEIPSMSEDWLEISHNMHVYVKTFRELDISLPVTEEEFESWRLTYDNLPYGHGNPWRNAYDDMPDPSQPTPHHTSPASSAYDPPDNLLQGIYHQHDNNILWLLMSGWYEFGVSIARNVQSFCKTFTFFPWALASMMPWDC